jgi:competence CoiA-like predicted nuclease
VAHARDASSFSDLLLPFGERIADERMMRVTEVANGLACGCVCAKCHRRLVARQGTIVRPHFAHEADAEYVGAFESSMHAVAKEMIAEAEERRRQEQTEREERCRFERQQAAALAREDKPHALL